MNDRNRVTVVATGLDFPEGPVVLPDGDVVFVEIGKGRVTRLQANGKLSTVADLGGGPNGAALGPDGHLYVCNNGGLKFSRQDGAVTGVVGRASSDRGGRIERVNLETGRSEVLHEACDGVPLVGPNDIVFDREGGFWFTDLAVEMGVDQIRLGRVCYARPDGSAIKTVVPRMISPNGIGISPDQKKLYVAETITSRLWEFEITAPGTLSPQGMPCRGGRMLFAPNCWSLFDSLAVEACGNIAIATLDRGGITVVSPQGQELDFVPMPDEHTTNICFGGADRRVAWITLSFSGQLVKMDWPRDGLALNF